MVDCWVACKWIELVDSTLSSKTSKFLPACQNPHYNQTTYASKVHWFISEHFIDSIRLATRTDDVLIGELLIQIDPHSVKLIPYNHHPVNPWQSLCASCTQAAVV